MCCKAATWFCDWEGIRIYHLHDIRLVVECVYSLQPSILGQFSVLLCRSFLIWLWFRGKSSKHVPSFNFPSFNLNFLCIFLCTNRSASYNKATGDCGLSDMDRMSIGSLNTLEAENGTDYMESNCVSDPTKLCDFKPLDGKILKTVDAVYQEVATEQDCK